jgi:flavodoxin
MKILVVYYSLTGNTRLIAEAVAKTLDADIEEIKPKNDDGGKGLLKMFWRGRSAVMQEKPELFPIEKDAKNYDLVVIGTPVWACNCTPAVYSYICANDLSKKRTAVFICHGGSPGKCLESMRKYLAKSEVIAEEEFIDPLFNSEENCLAKAIAWAEKIKK